jgi:hypothetical protein
VKRAAIAAGIFVTVLVVVLAGDHRAVERSESPRAAPASPIASTASGHHGFGSLYGRVTTHDGSAYAGRLRFGRDEEAFWGNYFNGFKAKNPWASQPQVAAVTPKRPAFTIFGFEIPLGERPIDLGRPFMARFGDIARIEEHGRDVRVTLKSGTVFDLAWGAANDFDDGLRVWDESRGVVDLASWAGGIPPPARVRIRTIELLPAAPIGAVPAQLHGTVRTRHGTFTGFVQWDRRACVATDEVVVRTAGRPMTVRFDAIRSIARRSSDSSLVTMLDGREIVLSAGRDGDPGSRGIYVDDTRYGRVLVSWEAFERIDFGAAGSGPAYGDFPRGHALKGTVTTRAGRRLTGRLVYDLDESETTETLDAPSMGVDYTIPFGLIASIAPPGGEDRAARRAIVTLHGGEELPLDRSGDLGDANAGLLIFDASKSVEYVRWIDVERVEFDRPPLMYPPLRGR